MTDLHKIKLQISDNRKIFALQEEFTGTFPFLKLEFFSQRHKIGGGTSKKLMKSNNQTIGECRTIHTKGHILISPKMTVAELEQQFRELYGLNVQLFRKSGKIWLETTVTDAWTLQQQNDQGEALSKIIFPNGRGPMFASNGI